MVWDCAKTFCRKNHLDSWNPEHSGKYFRCGKDHDYTRVRRDRKRLQMHDAGELPRTEAEDEDAEMTVETGAKDPNPISEARRA